MDVLRRTPGTLHALLGDLDEAWSRATEGPQTFSPFDVVGHLITGEETEWIPRTRRILEQGTSVPFDRFDRFAMHERDVGISLVGLVERFAVLRRANLATLEELGVDADLDRRGLHPSLGEVTLRELLATWAVHDLDHIAQIYAGLAGSHHRDIDRREDLGVVGKRIRQRCPAGERAGTQGERRRRNRGRTQGLTLE